MTHVCALNPTPLNPKPQPLTPKPLNSKPSNPTPYALDVPYIPLYDLYKPLEKCPAMYLHGSVWVQLRARPRARRSAPCARSPQQDAACLLLAPKPQVIHICILIYIQIRKTIIMVKLGNILHTMYVYT